MDYDHTMQTIVSLLEETNGDGLSIDADIAEALEMIKGGSDPKAILDRIHTANLRARDISSALFHIKRDFARVHGLDCTPMDLR